MNKYELVYVLKSSIGEEAIAEASKKIQDLVAANGSVTKVDDWGKRRLAYQIQDEKEGYYVILNFEADAEFPKELDRILKITDSVIRHLIIREDD